jgi:aminoglycoside 3-N-acetyltransferase
MAKKPYSPEGKTVVRKDDIIEGLRNLGVNPGDAVFFHNSLSSMGYVECGAETVIDAFLEAVGHRGTVAVNSCHFNGWHCEYAQTNRTPAFDVRRSPSRMGRITEVFRHHPGAVRCLDSSNPICSIGHHAEYLAEGAIRCFTPCGRDTAWGKLGELDAHYMFLGTGWNSCTMMHACEEYGHAPYALMDEPSRLEVADERGRNHLHVQKVHTPNVPRDYFLMEPEMQKRELVQYGQIGDAKVTKMNARELIDEGTRCIVEDPGFLLKDRSFIEQCRDHQRGLIPPGHQGASDV